MPWIVASPDKRLLLEDVVRSVWPSEQRYDEETNTRLSYLSDPALIRSVVGRDYRLFMPSSSFALVDLESEWSTRYPDTPLSLSESVYAYSPIVFFARPELLRRLGHRIGWRTLFDLPESVRLMRAHGNGPDGLAISTAAYLAASSGRRTTDEAADARVRQIEARVFEYGPDDLTVLSRAAPDGDWRADLVIAQERAVLAAVQQSQLRGVIIYPRDGTVQVDQLLALRNTPAGDDHDVQAFHALARQLTDPRKSGRLLAQSLHPRGTNAGTRSAIRAIQQAMPTNVANRVSFLGATAPPMVLPGRQVLRTYGARWESTKRGADVCLAIDLSSSMAGQKFTAAVTGARAFVDQLAGRDSRVAIIGFNSWARVMLGFSASKADVHRVLDGLSADGETALLNAIDTSLDELEHHSSSGKLRAVIALTDGMDNRSTVPAPTVAARLAGHGALLFAIAYGADADLSTLTALAGADGMVVKAGPLDVEQIYAALSHHL